MKDELRAPGLPASWLNAWLAAIGVTVLVPDATLHWEGMTSPTAVFGGTDVFERLVIQLSDRSLAEDLAIARHRAGSINEFPRIPKREAYVERCVIARRHGDFSLSSTVTDLDPTNKDYLAHSPLDAVVPQGITIHQRLSSCLAAIGEPAQQLAATLAGNAPRSKLNGLGFDYSRFQSATVPSNAPWCDPVIEVLAFFGLALLPVRGDGRRAILRGWHGGALKSGAFAWPAWSVQLAVAGIDALLDLCWSGQVPKEVFAGFRTVAYQPKGLADTRRAYASERV